MLVEADRSLPREDRREFRATKAALPGRLVYEICHKGFPNYKRQAYCGDLDELECQGFIRYGSHHRVLFDVTAAGYEAYCEIKERDGNPLEKVESSLLAYLDEGSFRQRFPNAYEKWMKAAHALVATNTDRLLTQIGHDCREAMQEFATVLVNEFHPAEVDRNKAHTVSRIRTILNQNKASMGMGEATEAFLDALLSYWGTIDDLVQRQEHGAQREGKALVWEDARRVVFHTGIVMYELDRTLHSRQ